MSKQLNKSLKYTAFFFGVTQKTVRNWVARGWISESTNGMYALEDVARGVIQGYVGLLNKKKGPDGDKHFHWEQLDKKEKAWGRMLKNIAMEEKLVPLNEIENKLSIIFVTFRDRLRALRKAITESIVKEILRKINPFFKEEIPADLERALINETEKMIEDSIDECLTELASSSVLSNTDRDTGEGSSEDVEPDIPADCASA